MSVGKTSKPDALSLLLQAEQEINASSTANSYNFYELLRSLATRIAPTDAFYICLYCEANKTLLFAYNFDSGTYDEPATVPLGKGPTSWVIRHGKPFILNDKDAHNAALHNANINFGNMQRVSRSAAHLPMRATGEGVQGRIVGVLSAQSYQPNAYDATAMQLLQWLADQAGSKLQRDRDTATVRHLINAAEARAEARQRHVTAMAGEFSLMLKNIGMQVEALRPLLPRGDKKLRHAVDNLSRECHRHQTEANQLPLRPCHEVEANPMARPATAPIALTRGEREVLELLPLGLSNTVIAQRLGISPDAVNWRLRGLYRKLGVSNRLQAAQSAASLLPATKKTTQSGR